MDDCTGPVELFLRHVQIFESRLTFRSDKGTDLFSSANNKSVPFGLFTRDQFGRI